VHRESRLSKAPIKRAKFFIFRFFQAAKFLCENGATLFFQCFEKFVLLKIEFDNFGHRFSALCALDELQQAP
jgi:hypothetical protein